jgi:hypothetical protein
VEEKLGLVNELRIQPAGRCELAIRSFTDLSRCVLSLLRSYCEKMKGTNDSSTTVGKCIMYVLHNKDNK